MGDETNSDTLGEVTVGGSLKLLEKVELSEVLDVLIVGGGPAGTATAFRAKELGLAALVIDRDEVLSILRDWMAPKDKPVDSSYGPMGKRVPFPAGGDLVGELVYGDRIPASELYGRWVKVYVERSIPAMAGLELVGIERDGDGLWAASCYSQRTREERRFRTRAIVLAMGRGVPHKLEVPGDTTGISYKVKDPNAFAGAPACVIGGGTSAAEAVIAISNAKAEAGDGTDVFWAYRRRRLPRVNATLAEEFFKAYAGNGNIRYLPYSEPLAVLRAGEEESMLLRSDRREISGRPTEGTYLEFPKERVLACIGADLPLQFLGSIGIHRLRAADTDEELMAVSPIFESCLANVFLIGDLLSPAFLQTNDFSPEALQSTVLNHVGNFKQGMTDGVLVAEAFRKRLDGAGDGEIAKALDDRRAEFERLHAERLEAARAEAPVEPAEETKRAPAPVVRVGARFVLLRLEDGDWVAEREHLVSPGRVVIGRNTGDLTFAGDENMVDDHAALLVETDACYITSDEMRGESFVDVRVERAIAPGDTIVAGSQRLRVESSGGRLSLAVLGASGNARARLEITEKGKIYGRRGAEVAIDPGDQMLSRRHFYLQAEGNLVKLRDFGSTNHTYLLVSGTARLNETDEICLGSQRFRFLGLQTGEEAVAAPPEATIAVDAAAAPAAPSAAAEPVPAAAPPAGGLAVTIVNREIAATLPLKAEQSLLDRFREAHLATDDRAKIGGKVQSLFECNSGTCGKCIVRVAAGMDSLGKLSGKEKRTIGIMAPELDLDAAACRLACMARALGAVEVELLGDTEPPD